MSVISRIVGLGYEYIQSLTHELHIAVAESSWFEAYRKACFVQSQLERHAGGIEHVISRRLAREAHGIPREFEQWMGHKRQLLAVSGELVRAVHDRDPDASHDLSRHLTALLAQSIRNTVDVALQIEALTGDMADDLGRALRGMGPGDS